MKPLDVNQVKALVQPVIAGLGYDLVDLEWKHEAVGWVLRAYIDFLTPPPAPPDAGIPVGVTLEDCTRVSRALSAELDVADAIPAHYNLEVSSPGVNRPLTKETDFARFAGQKAKIKTRRPVGENRRNFKGTLKGAAAGKVTIEVDGTDFQIEVADVEKANLEFEF